MMDGKGIGERYKNNLELYVGFKSWEQSRTGRLFIVSCQRCSEKKLNKILRKKCYEVIFHRRFWLFWLVTKGARLRTQKPFVKWLHVCFSVSNRTKTVLLPLSYISILALTPLTLRDMHILIFTFTHCTVVRLYHICVFFTALVTRHCVRSR